MQDARRRSWVQIVSRSVLFQALFRGGGTTQRAFNLSPPKAVPINRLPVCDKVVSDVRMKCQLQVWLALVDVFSFASVLTFATQERTFFRRAKGILGAAESTDCSGANDCVSSLDSEIFLLVSLETESCFLHGISMCWWSFFFPPTGKRCATFFCVAIIQWKRISSFPFLFIFKNCSSVCKCCTLASSSSIVYCLTTYFIYTINKKNTAERSLAVLRHVTLLPNKR